MYKHTQTGGVIVGAAGAFVILMLVIMAFAGFELTPLLLALVIAIPVALLFGTLTIEVERATIQWRFGIGLIGGSINLAEIDSVEKSRTQWYWGWGLRWTPRGVLYNVSGLDTVDIRLKDGKRIRLGTDEPGRLVQAINELRPA